MKENLIKDKSYQFSLKIIYLYKKLITDKKEFVLSKQILRSGTSIGANVEEAVGAQSRNDFVSKLSIAYKEARETHYWIRLLVDSGYLEKTTSEQLLNDCEEILRIIGKIQTSTKAR